MIEKRVEEKEVEKKRLRENELLREKVEYEEAFDQSYTHAQADEIIGEGKWAGFTRSDAFAWSHSFLYFEPPRVAAAHKVMHLFQVKKELKEGKLPEVFRYVERARELAEAGMTPHQYRAHREEILRLRDLTGEEMTR